MICKKCKRDFEEKEIQERHDVPCYLFYNLFKRNERKNKADKLGRHWLCKECHKKYEENLSVILKATAIKFARRWFNGF